MGVTFSEGRALPREFTRGSGYQGMTDGEAVASAIRSISPWDMLTGIFVTKPAQEHAAQVAIAQAQQQAQSEALAVRGASTRTMVLVGGGLVALLAIVLVMRRKPSSVAGYRKRHSKRSRR